MTHTDSHSSILGNMELTDVAVHALNGHRADTSGDKVAMHWEKSLIISLAIVVSPAGSPGRVGGMMHWSSRGHPTGPGVVDAPHLPAPWRAWLPHTLNIPFIIGQFDGRISRRFRDKQSGALCNVRMLLRESGRPVLPGIAIFSRFAATARR